MGEQAATSEGLQALVDACAGMIEYSEALRSGAAGFAYLLPAEWQGPAFSRFLTAFETWAASAAALTVETEQLCEYLGAVRSAYEQGSAELDQAWAAFRSSMGV